MVFEEGIMNQIGLPENDRLKYEPLLPSSGELGRLICAFANTDGGILILGVLSKNNKILVKGLSTDFQVNVVLTNTLAKISPLPSIESDFFQYQGNQLFGIKVIKSEYITSFDQIAYAIKSKKIVKLNLNTETAPQTTANMTIEIYLDEILKYLVEHPGLINVNKHTVRETILKNKVSVSEGAQLISKLRDSGYVKSYGDRFIGVSIDTKPFLDKGGFSGSKIYSSIGGQKKIFISYNWNDKVAANKLYEFLKVKGYSPSIDDHSLSYKDSISTFMESIRAVDFAVLMISDLYLKSENCMVEVLHVLKDRNSHDKVLPIRHADVKIFHPSDRMKYVEFWKLQVEARETLLEGVDPTTTIEEIKKLKNAKRIHQDIGDFLSDISDMITKTIEEEEKSSYKGVINYIER